MPAIVALSTDALISTYLTVMYSRTLRHQNPVRINAAELEKR